MTEAELIQKLRKEIGDTSEPYKFTPEYLSSIIHDAVGDYSGHRPRKIKGKISLVPGTTEYPMPEGYQTWIRGLDGYEIFDKTLYLDTAPIPAVDIDFVYLGNHTVETVPVQDINLIMDYCMWKLLGDIVRDGAEISGLKLGKGLDIEFDNFDQIEKLASKHLDNYRRNVIKTVGGCT